ncbi:MAG TPA: hypothetical protein VFK69_13760 [Candidatus Eisenbacteria bacterium]|nr:hypothetical protein [Candidatus Eisenbacteria bacterium]
MQVANDGTIGMGPFVAGTWFPPGTGLAILFDAGLWVAAEVRGELRVAVSEYESEYGPGVIAAPGAWADPGDPRFKVYKVVPWTGDPGDTAARIVVPTEVGPEPVDPVIHDSWSRYLNGAAPFGAPVRTWRLPNTTTPDPLDSVDVAGPDVPGTQLLWSVYNDADPARHKNISGGTTPLGIEVRQMVWTLAGDVPLQNSIFMRWTITNRSADTLSALRAGVWSDPDLGASYDDMVGCDSSRALAFAYNATDHDAVYGNRPPALGFDLLAGIPGSYGAAGFAAFRRTIGGAEPVTPQQTLDDLSGLDRDGTPLVNAWNGAPTTYEDSGDPLTHSGWLDPAATDKHMLIGTGPGTLAPGDSVVITAVLMAARCSSALLSLQALETNDDAVQAVWDGTPPGGFIDCPEPVPPAPPGLALAGFGANPARGELVIDLTLGADAPARIDVLDVTGRRVWSRALPTPVAGHQWIPLDRSLPPAVYFLRLTQGTQHISTRAVVLR